MLSAGRWESSGNGFDCLKAEDRAKWMRRALAERKAIS